MPSSCCAADYAEQSSHGKVGSDLEPLLQLIPGPAVHPDLSAFPDFASPNQHGTARAVKIGFGKIECLADPQPGAPEQHDQSSQTRAIWPAASGAHNGDDLLDGGRIGRVSKPLVPRSSAVVIPGHRGRRAAMTSSIQQHRFHVPSSLMC
jgi:hypothetical protein